MTYVTAISHFYKNTISQILVLTNNVAISTNNFAELKVALYDIESLQSKIL